MVIGLNKIYQILANVVLISDFSCMIRTKSLKKYKELKAKGFIVQLCTKQELK